MLLIFIREPRDLHLGLIFIVSLSTCGCWYINGTFLVSTGELSYIIIIIIIIMALFKVG